jgi:hypothetical protein
MFKSRKFVLGLFYLTGMFGLTALLIVKHTTPDFIGLGVLAGGLASGVYAVTHGISQEYVNGKVSEVAVKATNAQ